MGGNIKGDVLVTGKTNNLQMLFTDERFCNIFSFPLPSGSSAIGPGDISSVIITETVAGKYFNRIDVVGKTMVMNGDPSAKRLGKPMVMTGHCFNIACRGLKDRQFCFVNSLSKGPACSSIFMVKNNLSINSN